jgi:hypothetical protein
MLSLLHEAAEQSRNARIESSVNKTHEEKQNTMACNREKIEPLLHRPCRGGSSGDTLSGDDAIEGMIQYSVLIT